MWGRRLNVQKKDTPGTQYALHHIQRLECAGIVKDYGGSIDIESQIGKGTTFKLTFPAVRA